MLKRLLLSTVLAVMIMSHIVIFVAVFTPNQSSYSFLTGVLDCYNIQHMRGCRHEIAHKMDQEEGMISKTPEFGHSVQTYLLKELRKENPSELAQILITYPGVYIYEPTQISSPQVEVYAAIYAWAEGDLHRIPRGLRKYYSSSPFYLSLYSCLSNPQQINICYGKNISYLAG